MKAVASLFLLCGFVFSQAGNSFFASAEYSSISATGTVSSNASERTVDLGRFSTTGINVGLIRPLTPRFSLRAYFTIGDGLEKGEKWTGASLSTSRGVETHDLRFTYQHDYYGLAAELLALFPGSARLKPYLYGGAGFHRYSVSLSVAVEDDTKRNGDPVNTGSASEHKACFSGLGGAGAAYRFHRQLYLFAQYKFRYWRPVEYSEDLVPGTPVDYLDTHLCHIIEGGVTVAF